MVPVWKNDGEHIRRNWKPSWTPREPLTPGGEQLFYIGGPEIRRIIRCLDQPGKTYAETIKQLDAYFEPRRNPFYEANRFMTTS